MSDSSPTSSRSELDRLEAWCRDSRRWRIASGLVPLVVGLATISMAASGDDLRARVQLAFGIALCVAAGLPIAQALERSEWLRVLAAVREHWGRDGSDQRQHAEAALRRLTSERMGVRS